MEPFPGIVDISLENVLNGAEQGVVEASGADRQAGAYEYYDASYYAPYFPSCPPPPPQSSNIFYNEFPVASVGYNNEFSASVGYPSEFPASNIYGEFPTAVYNDFYNEFYGYDPTATYGAGVPVAQFNQYAYPPPPSHLFPPMQLYAPYINSYQQPLQQDQEIPLADYQKSPYRSSYDDNSFNFPKLPTILQTQPVDANLEASASTDDSSNNSNGDEHQQQQQLQHQIPIQPIQQTRQQISIRDEARLKKLLAFNASKCDQRIRYKNRDYYGVPVRLNVAKADNLSTDDNAAAVFYDVMTKRSKSTSRVNGRAKTAPMRNPLSTKLTVKNLLKLMELQHQMLPTVKAEADDSNGSASSLSKALVVVGQELDVANGSEESHQGATDNLEDQLKAAAEDCELGFDGRRLNLIPSSTPSLPSNSGLSLPLNATPGAPVLVESFLLKKQKPMRNRSYEFLSIQIGCFGVHTSAENLSRNKLKFFFGQNQLVYDFVYDYCLPTVDGASVSCVKFLVMVSIQLETVKGAVFKSREFELSLDSAPRMVCGYNRAELPTHLKEFNFGTSSIDITHGELASVFCHKIVLPRAQGALIEKHLLAYNPALRRPGL